MSLPATTPATKFDGKFEQVIASKMHRADLVRFYIDGNRDRTQPHWLIALDSTIRNDCRDDQQLMLHWEFSRNVDRFSRIIVEMSFTKDNTRVVRQINGRRLGGPDVYITPDECKVRIEIGDNKQIYRVSLDDREVQLRSIVPMLPKELFEQF